MSAENLTFFLPDDAATSALGTALAKIVQPGDIVLLQGELGAGKTALARAVIRTLIGNPDLDVPSPSFALVQPYEAGSQAIIHADLYRLADAREIDELGILDEPLAIMLIEWPERAPELLDKAAITIKLELGANGEGRNVQVDLDTADRDLATHANKAGLNALPPR